MIDNDFDDIFNLMDKIFGMDRGQKNISSSSSKNNYERIINEDELYYTFELRHVEKDNINVQPFEEKLLISIYDENGENEKVISLPYKIRPDNTKVTFKNGILDITLKIDEEKSNIVEIE